MRMRMRMRMMMMMMVVMMMMMVMMIPGSKDLSHKSDHLRLTRMGNGTRPS